MKFLYAFSNNSKNALDEHKDSKVLIFSGTKVGCDHLGSALFRAGYEDVATLHGDKTQVSLPKSIVLN